MKTTTQAKLVIALLLFSLRFTVACGADPTAVNTEQPVPATSSLPSGADAALPPIGEVAPLVAWLETGVYRQWSCEASPHAARPPGAHGFNRICSNALLSGHGSGEYPIGAAAVKELYDGSHATVVGYAYYQKVAAGQAEGWYWFEGLKAGSVFASGRGDSGSAKAVCVGCHRQAGRDGLSGHDFVFTQVR